MPTLHTHLFSIEAPKLFEKALWMGQLIRMERMDREEGERSFAEVNFFVGYVAEENIDVAHDEPEAAVLTKLWRHYLEAEQRLAPVADDALVIDEQTDRSRLALVRLTETSWRPEVGQLVWIELPRSADGWVFARLVLEFDWAHRATYEPLGHSILESLRWSTDDVTRASLEEQKEGVWSIFDDMDSSQRDAIARRYRAVLGQRPPDPAEAAPQSLSVMDLTTMDPSEITVEALDHALAPTDHGARGVILRTAFLADPIEFSFDEGDDDSSHSFGAATAVIVRALQSLGPKDHARAGELMWEHCKMCFEATDYGAGDQSNEDYFGIHGPTDAFAEAGKATIYLSGDQGAAHHHIFALDFYPPWEVEHGCSLVVRDGALVGWSDPGGWLGEFADD